MSERPMIRRGGNSRNWPEVLQPILNTVVGAVIAGVFLFIPSCYVEKQKQQHELYVRKEALYRGLLDKVNAFQVSNYDPNKIDEFIREFRVCLLYCPDDVIEKGHRFMNMVRADSPKKHSQEEMKAALSEFMYSMRRDLHNDTRISAEGLEVLNATRPADPK